MTKPKAHHWQGAGPGMCQGPLGTITFGHGARFHPTCQHCGLNRGHARHYVDAYVAAHPDGNPDKRPEPEALLPCDETHYRNGRPIHERIAWINEIPPDQLRLFLSFYGDPDATALTERKRRALAEAP